MQIMFYILCFKCPKFNYLVGEQEKVELWNHDMSMFNILNFSTDFNVYLFREANLHSHQFDVSYKIYGRELCSCASNN